MSLEGRLRRLEKQRFGKHGGRCPLCKGHGVSPRCFIVKSRDERPPIEPCPRCGAVPRHVKKIVLEDRPSVPPEGWSVDG